MKAVNFFFLYLFIEIFLLRKQKNSLTKKLLSPNGVFANAYNKGYFIGSAGSRTLLGLKHIVVFPSLPLSLSLCHVETPMAVFRIC